MLTLLAKDRFFWTLRLSGRPLEETRRRARWKVARIQGPVSVAIGIYWIVVEDAKLPINTGTF